jgi:hypothetical protein
MTSLEAIEIARLKAEELNYPWCSKTAMAKRRRVWPFPPFWRVVSRVQSDSLTVTMNVYERTKEAKPIRALYSNNEPEPVQLRLVLLFALKFIVSGCLVWVLMRYAGHASVWRATLVAIPGALAGTIFFEMLDAKMRMGKDEAKDKDDADVL